jgi:hypothetical protein
MSILQFSKLLTKENNWATSETIKARPFQRVQKYFCAQETA